jgi:nucleoside-diphosphate-sugar epimerase
MTVVVTGGGFVASHIVSRLVADGNDVHVLSRSDASEPKMHISCDLRDRQQIRRVCCDARLSRVDAIVHTAAVMASSSNVREMSLFYDNVALAEGAAFLAQTLKAVHLVNISSVAVYAATDGSHDETAAIGPSANGDCLYGLAKFVGENIIDHLLRGSSTAVTHLRVAQVYGEGMREDRIMPAMRRELAESGSITVYGAGERVGSFIEVGSLAEDIATVLRICPAGVFNVGGENLSYAELARRMIQRYGNARSKLVFREEGSRCKFYLDTSKFDAVKRRR